MFQGLALCTNSDRLWSFVIISNGCWMASLRRQAGSRLANAFIAMGRGPKQRSRRVSVPTTSVIGMMVAGRVGKGGREAGESPAHKHHRSSFTRTTGSGSSTPGSLMAHSRRIPLHLVSSAMPLLTAREVLTHAFLFSFPFSYVFMLQVVSISVFISTQLYASIC